MGSTALRAVTTTALAIFGLVMAGIAWDELVGKSSVPDAFAIPLFGLPAFFASMAWLARHLESVLSESADKRPRWSLGALSARVFFIPGGALYVAWSALRESGGAISGASRIPWAGWAVSCAGMQVSMIAELSGASPTITFDGLYAAFGVLNALAVVTLMWTPRPFRHALAVRTSTTATGAR